MEWDLLKAIEMWNSGKSALEIRNYFWTESAPLTRNAVIGRLHRARYQGHLVVKRAEPNRRKKPKKVKFPSKPSAFITIKPLKKELKVRKGGTFFIYELEPGQCKYAMGEAESGEHLFCGAHTEKTYCEEHHNICHVRQEKKEQGKRKKNK